MEAFLSLTFWLPAMVMILGTLVLAPFVLGVLGSRHSNKQFRKRLYAGYYEDIRGRSLTEVAERATI